MKDDEMQTLVNIVDSMHKLAEGLETMAVFLLRDASEQPVESASQTKASEPEPALPQVTLEEVRAVLAAKSAAGHTAKVRDLLKEFGAAKLSAVKPEDYAALKAKAEVL